MIFPYNHDPKNVILTAVVMVPNNSEKEVPETSGYRHPSLFPAGKSVVPQ